MRLQRLAFYFCITAVGASMAEYQELCPNFHETKIEITHGEWALVKCGMVGSHDGKRSQIAGIPSPAACAQLCSEDASCTHSSWGSGGKCLLSGTKFAEREIKNSVLLVKTVPDEPEDECPEDDPYCDDEELCEERLEESKNQLEDCVEEKATCHEQLDRCLAEKQALLQELISAPSTESGSEIDDLPHCDKSHGTIFTAPNNKSFKINCRQGGTFSPFKIYQSGTFAHCVKECTYHQDCKAAEFVMSGRQQGHCRLHHLSKGDTGIWGPKENRASAVLIGE